MCIRDRAEGLLVDGGGPVPVAAGAGDGADIVQADGEVAQGLGGGDPLGEVPGDGEGFLVEGGGAVPVAAGSGEGADIVQADGEVAQGLGGCLLYTSRCV